MRKGVVVSSVSLLIFSVLWYVFISAELTKLPKDFEYQAELISRDNFFDSDRGEYVGTTDSQSNFSYRALATIDGVRLIENLFTVRTASGDRIFSAERLYGIDPYTMRHVSGYGDADRAGYLFGPRNSSDAYTYWHINYPDPITMNFVGVEDMFGVSVNRYRGEFTTDQTNHLGHLPGVPEERGVIVSGIIETWVHEPTGYLVAYNDTALAEYYDSATGDVIEPWNRFENTFTDISKAQKAQEAQKLHYQHLSLTYLPAILAFCIGGYLLFLGKRRNVREKNKKSNNSDHDPQA